MKSTSSIEALSTRIIYSHASSAIATTSQPVRLFLAVGAGCGHSGAGGAGQRAASSGLKRALYQLRAERPGSSRDIPAEAAAAQVAQSLGQRLSDRKAAEVRTARGFLEICPRLQRGSRRCSHSSCIRGAWHACNGVCASQHCESEASEAFAGSAVCSTAIWP